MEQEKIYNNTNVNLKQTKLKLVLFVILIAGIVLFSKGIFLIKKLPLQKNMLVGMPIIILWQLLLKGEKFQEQKLQKQFIYVVVFY